VHGLRRRRCSLGKAEAVAVIETSRLLPADQIDRGKARAARAGALFGCLALVPDILAVLLSGSATLLADVLKSGSETVGLFLTWGLLARIVRSRDAGRKVDIVRLERWASGILAAALFVSAGVVLATAVSRLATPILIEQVWLGVLANIGAAVINLRLCVHNRRLWRERQSRSLEAQWRLFVTKLVTNLVVIATLLASVLLVGFWWTPYLDPLTSLLVGGFILLNAWRVARLTAGAAV
jgi:divalent metal cation (Fe/Co/Zn/Cd) transporter